MSQAPVALLAALPRIDPQSAVGMRPAEGGEGFSAIARLFGLDAEAPQASPLRATPQVGEAAGSGGPGQGATDGGREHASDEALPFGTPHLLHAREFLPLLTPAPEPSTMPAGDSDASVQAPAFLRAFPMVQKSGRPGQGLKGPVPGGAMPVPDTVSPGGSETALQTLRVAGIQLPIEGMPGRDGSPAPRALPVTLPADAGAAASPATQSASDLPIDPEALAETMQDTIGLRRTDAVAREGWQGLAEWSSQRPDTARFATGSEGLLAARGDVGLQTGSPNPQPMSGVSVPPPPMSAAAGQTFDHVALMVRQGVSEARLQLKPADLGQVDIRIEVDGNEARVQMTVQQAQVREALEQLLPRLREALAGQGVELTDATVDHGERQSSQKRDESGAEPATRFPGESGDPDQAAEQPASSGAGATRIGLVDAYA